MAEFFRDLPSEQYGMVDLQDLVMGRALKRRARALKVELEQTLAIDALCFG